MKYLLVLSAAAAAVCVVDASLVTEYVSGANCGLSKEISVLDREPTADERSGGCLLVKKFEPNAVVGENVFGVILVGGFRNRTDKYF